MLSALSLAGIAKVFASLAREMAGGESARDSLRSREARSLEALAVSLGGGDDMNRHELHACGAFVAVDVVAAGRRMLDE